MANYCDSSYTLVGSEEEIKALHKLMTKTLAEKQNGNWVGHLVQALNNEEIPEHLYVRGWWDDLNCEGDTISFHQESAWEPLYEAWDFIASKFKTIKVYFIGEEPGFEVYLKREHPEKRWYSENYLVEGCTPDGSDFREYFDTFEEARRYAEKMAETNLITYESIEALSEAWSEENTNSYISLYEFEGV